MQAETYPHIASEQFELLQQLSQLIESVRIIDNEPLWTAADVAEYLRVGEASVLKNFCYMPGFPAGFRLPSRRGSAVDGGGLQIFVIGATGKQENNTRH